MEQPQDSANPHAPSGVTVAIGVGIGFALHVIQALFLCLSIGVMASLAGSTDPAISTRFGEIAVVIGIALSPLAIGLNQLLYLVPAIVVAWRFGRIGILLGLVIAAAVTFLLNAACWGAFVIGIQN